MEKWTREELEALYKKINEHLKTDADFAAAVKEDFGAAVMKLAGRELPKGFKLSLVAGEAGHEASLALPDFTSDELNLNDLATVPGGALPGTGTIRIDKLCGALQNDHACVTYWCYQDQIPTDPDCPMHVCGAEALPSGDDSCLMNICVAEARLDGNPCMLEAPVR